MNMSRDSEALYRGGSEAGTPDIRKTRLKTLPSRNFVDGGKYADQTHRQTDMDIQLPKHSKHSSVMVRMVHS